MREHLPALSLPDATGAPPIALRDARGPRVVVTLHDARCDACVAYAERIAAARAQLAEWGADLVLVSAQPDADGRLAGLGPPLLVDGDGTLAGGRLRVIVVDEWGEIFFASDGDGPHAPIEPDEAVEWARFVAIQCPECEQPEGGWRDL